MVSTMVMICGVPAQAASAPTSWRVVQTATVNRLSTVDVVSEKVVWAAGGGLLGAVDDGSVVRTFDGGRTWRDVTPFGDVSEPYRDVEAFGRDQAVVLSSKDGLSRIYRTADGGTTWRVAFSTPLFFDCMAFFDNRHGLAVADSVDGRFPLLVTDDGGRTWLPTPVNAQPIALPGEGARATGTCLTTFGRHDVWFGTWAPTGNGRVLHSADGGRTWATSTTQLPAGDTHEGVSTLSFRDRHTGLASGGTVATNGDVGTVNVTTNGGRSWVPTKPPAGVRIGVAWVPDLRETAVAVGRTGSDISTDGGRTWRLIDHISLFGVNCPRHGPCWAVGENGKAAKLMTP
jgi:photosystem II stability/assembly factor-like uncharacterized protein